MQLKGTTSIRTIESLYWFGVRLLTSASDGNSVRYGKAAGVSSAATADDDLLFVDQWEPYAQMDRFDDNGLQLPSAEDALGAVLDWCGGEDGVVHGGTNLLIVPGYPFRL